MGQHNEAVWCEWNALGGDEPSPVKTIARKLALSNAEVAAIVYPDRRMFGVWEDWQEPPLSGDSEPPEHARKRERAEQRARLREADDETRRRALGES